jgi:heme exporter protein C
MNKLFGRVFPALWLVTSLLMVVALWMVFLRAPEERVMGAAQKIFYFHVPSAIVTFAAVFLLLGASVAYLWTRDLLWDNLSRASTETALLFCTIVLITGPLWAKPAWGVWWTWEAKLTTTLILWLLLAGCLMVRGYSENRDQAARLAAILGVFAAVDIPIIYRATTWWRGQHPVLFEPNKKVPLAPAMQDAFLVCMAVFFLLFTLMLILRFRVAHLEDRTDGSLERLSSLRQEA